MSAFLNGPLTYFNYKDGANNEKFYDSYYNKVTEASELDEQVRLCPGFLSLLTGERVAHKAPKLIGCWCRGLEPTAKSIDVYLGLQNRWVFFNCGCHRGLRDGTNDYEQHNAFAECVWKTNHLVECIRIGIHNESIFKPITNNEWWSTKLICKMLHCKNCLIFLCVKLDRFIRTHYNPKKPSDLMLANEFSKIIAIYLTSTLFVYCLAYAHTASYWMGAKFDGEQTKVSVLEFIRDSVLFLYRFHRDSLDDDPTDAVIFRVAIDAFGEFLGLFVKQSGKMNPASWWKASATNNHQFIQDLFQGGSYFWNT